MATQYYLETPWDITPDSSSRFEFYNPDDQLISGNGVDPIQKYDGIDFVDLEGNAPKGNIFAIYKDRLMVSGDPRFPHRWWYSHIRNAEGWTPEFFWIDIFPEDGGKCNGGVVEGDELVISKTNGRKYGWKIYEDGDPTNSLLRKIEDSKGNVNKKAETVLEDIDYYLDHEAIFTVPRGPKGGLSYIVQEVIEAIPASSLANIAAGSNDGKVYMSLGDIHLDIEEGIDIKGAVLVYDTINESFFIRDEMYARAFTRFAEATNAENLYFGTNDGKVFVLDDSTIAGSKPLHMRIRTKPFFKDLGRMVSVSKIGIYMTDPDGTNVTYRMDTKSPYFYNLGQVITEPVHWFDVSDAKGPLLQLEFTHSNPTIRPTLQGIEIVYHVEGDLPNLK